MSHGEAVADETVDPPSPEVRERVGRSSGLERYIVTSSLEVTARRHEKHNKAGDDEQRTNRHPRPGVRIAAPGDATGAVGTKDSSLGRSVHTRTNEER